MGDPDPAETQSRNQRTEVLLRVDTALIFDGSDQDRTGPSSGIGPPLQIHGEIHDAPGAENADSLERPLSRIGADAPTARDTAFPAGTYQNRGEPDASAADLTGALADFDAAIALSGRNPGDAGAGLAPPPPLHFEELSGNVWEWASDAAASSKPGEEAGAADRSGTPASEPTLAAGTLIGDSYKVMSHLGSGGFGNVYRVEYVKGYLPQDLALKISRPSVSALNVPGLRHHLKLWKVLSDREHEHVVRLLSVEPVTISDAAAIGIFMEYMPGGSLGHLVGDRWRGRPRSRRDLSQVARLFSQACHAVRSVHKHKQLHRDIKPDNLLLNEQATRCKLSDFDLLIEASDGRAVREVPVGTVPYMAPECWDGKYSAASDIFALGATLYQLLAGVLAFPQREPSKREAPKQLADLNPLVDPELSAVVGRCLERNPAHRPFTVDDLLEDLACLGFDADESNTAPVSLSRLLLTHLPYEEVQALVRSLERRGFLSTQTDPAARAADVISEYCYTTSPREVLSENCSVAQLASVARAIGVVAGYSDDRAALIDAIIAGTGFLRGERQVPGVEATRSTIEGQFLDLAHATSVDECAGMIQSGLLAIERILDLLIRFYGQALYGSGYPQFISRTVQGRSLDKLTFGHKVQVLRELSRKPPEHPISPRTHQAFGWPLFPPDVIEGLNTLVSARNALVHAGELATLREAQHRGRQILSVGVDWLGKLGNVRHVPRVVQVISRQDDLYGRHFYLGRDDRGRTERIFTPLQLRVGALYLFHPTTNPVRINPLIFPFESLEA